jgi:glycosyltransferase involved in cell wall biosynthesis
MRIVLLQDEIYLPSLGGGIKANRFLLECLSARGHETIAICPAFTGAQVGPRNYAAFQAEMGTRRIEFRSNSEGVFSYRNEGVFVEAIDFEHAQNRDRLAERIQRFEPDWIVVTDDKRRFLLDRALQAAPDRVILLLQTIVQLPFGPLSVQLNPEQTRRMRQARAIRVISEFQRRHILEHSGLEAEIVRLPVYGGGPFAIHGSFDKGLVTMINPCELKGAQIFLALAKRFPQTAFAAVPTWGTDDVMRTELAALPNVQVLPAVDDIDEILAQTRVLLVPSLWPETFGYVVPEAMLRGIPVLASNVGGLPEAKLGVDYVLPVRAAELRDCRYVSPPQDANPWAEALQQLLNDRTTYTRCSEQSRAAALSFVATTDVSQFEQFLNRLPNT